MKVSVVEAREVMKKLVVGGADFTWNENSLHGSWLSFTIKTVVSDRVETMIDRVSSEWAYEVDDKQGLTRFDLYDFTKDSTKEVRHTIKVKQWLTRKNDNPIPMRTMEGVVIRETNKAVMVKLNGLLKPSRSCLHCNRELTHPVSVLYGIGPVCGQHFHINPCDSEEELETRYNEMAERMSNVKWEGWIPKSQIESMQIN